MAGPAQAAEPARGGSARGSERGTGWRRRRDLAVLLPLVGGFLLVSPLIRVFAAEATLFGIPLIILYVFGVWAGLIGASAVLARRLSRGPEDA